MTFKYVECMIQKNKTNKRFKGFIMFINISGNIDFEYSLSRSDVISYYSLLGLMNIDHIRLVEAADSELGFLTFSDILVQKKSPVLLSTSQVQPGRIFSQLSDLSVAPHCTWVGGFLYSIFYQILPVSSSTGCPT